MRRSWFLTLCAACVGLQCSTDTFNGVDGSVDAGADAVTTTDGGGADAGSSDAHLSSDSPPLCPFDGGVVCGPSKGGCGNLGPCCVTTSSTVCAASVGGACTGASFACMTQADCADAGAVCCISMTGTGCPHTLYGSSSQCVAPSSCSYPEHRACTSDADCSGQATCQTVSIGGLTMGACLGG